MAAAKADMTDVFGESEGGDVPPEDSGDEAAMEEFLSFAREAFPDTDEDRLRALKHAIEVCVENTMGGGY